MDNELFGYSLFTEQPEPLKTYNRCVVMMGMVERGHREQAEEYYSQFNGKDTSSIFLMATKIKEIGIEEVKKQVVSNVDWDSTEN